MPPIKNFPAEPERQNLALLAAAKTGDAKDLSSALAAGADPHAKTFSGLTAPMHAALRGMAMTPAFKRSSPPEPTRTPQTSTDKPPP